MKSDPLIGVRLERTLLVALSLLLGGCMAAPPPLPGARPLGRELPGGSRAAPLDAASRERFREAFVEPTGDLDLNGALAASLVRSPRLDAFAWQVRADEARALQTGLLPNPTLLIEGENLAGSGIYDGFAAAEISVFLGQRVELGGKRAKRRRVALLDRELSGWDYESARLDVLTETTRRFVAALAAKERLVLARDLLENARAALAATEARVRAGAASQVEAARSGVVLATLEVQVERRTLEHEAARSLLASSWAGRTTRFGELIGDLTIIRELPSLEQFAAAIAGNPDLARWSTENARREADLALARAGAIPNVTAGLGLRHFENTDDNALLFGIEIPLPVFDRNQGAKGAALAESHRIRALAREARQALDRALIARHAEAQVAYRTARALEHAVLPQAAAAYKSTEAGYRKGLFRLVDVFDAQRALAEARSEYVDMLEHYHAATSQLERLAGAPLAQIPEIAQSAQRAGRSF